MSVKIRPYRGQTGVWEVDIQFLWPDGTQYRKRVKSSVTGKEASKRWGQEREARLLAQGHPKPDEHKKEVPTIKQFEQRFMDGYVIANRQKPSSKENKKVILKAHIMPHLGDVRLDEVSHEHVQAIKARMHHRHAKTVNNVLSTLNVMLKAAVEWQVIDRLPVTIKLLKLPPLNKEEFYDFADYERLVAAATKLEWAALAVVLLGGDAGLRRGEIMAFEQADADHKRSFITVRRSDWKGQVTPPKNGRVRRVPMTKRLAELLSANRHLRGARLLYQPNGKPLDSASIRALVEAVERRAGLPVTGKLHVLRHTFCSHLAMRGASTLDIKELAGHSSIMTTQRYMHLSPMSADRAIKLLDEGRAKDRAVGEMLEKATPDGNTAATIASRELRQR